MPMYFKLSARELEILEDRETILKKLAENQVSLASMVRVKVATDTNILDL